MSIQQAAVTARAFWNRKPTGEKVVARIMLGLAALAAGNSGYHLMLTLMVTLVPAMHLPGVL